MLSCERLEEALVQKKDESVEGVGKRFVYYQIFKSKEGMKKLAVDGIKPFIDKLDWEVLDESDPKYPPVKFQDIYVVNLQKSKVSARAAYKVKGFDEVYFPLSLAPTEQGWKVVRFEPRLDVWTQIVPADAAEEVPPQQ